MHAYSKYLFILFLINGISLGYLYQFYQGKINHIRLELKNQRNKNQLLKKKVSAHPTIQNILSDTHQRTTLLLRKMKTIDLSELDNQFIHKTMSFIYLKKGKRLLFRMKELMNYRTIHFKV